MNLREARRHLGLSLDEAAEKIGVARQTLERAELGARLYAKSERAIAEFYGVSVAEAFPDPKPTEAAA